MVLAILASLDERREQLTVRRPPSGRGSPGVDRRGAKAREAPPPTVIQTNWSERLEFASGKGFLRLYVRKLALTRTSWTAAVGLTNASSQPIRVSAQLV